MLSLEALTYGVGRRTIIDAVSLQLSERGRTVVLGPNGAGKSVLLRLCLGLIRPTGGRILWMGRGPRGVRKAIVFQRPVMLRRSTFANITHALSLAGVPQREIASRAQGALAMVGLEAVAHRPARVLSGGEQQRVALARAWALEPHVLFLDEPTANLDPTATRQVEEIIQSIHDAGTKIVMTTHNLGQARRMGDEIVMLSHGRLVEHGAANHFFHAPVSSEAAAFIKGELPW